VWSWLSAVVVVPRSQGDYVECLPQKSTTKVASVLNVSSYAFHVLWSLLVICLPKEDMLLTSNVVEEVFFPLA
jgi:hypothetical protein